MDCRDVDRLMDPYLDRELVGESAREVEEHLAGCPACRARYGRMVGLLTTAEAIDVPAGLRDRIMSTVTGASGAGAETPSRRRPGSAKRIRWWVWPVGVAAGVAVFWGGWFASHLWDQPEGNGPQLVEKEEGDPLSGDTVVVLSPWMLSSYAQAVAMQGAAGPMYFAAHAAAAEVMSTSLTEETPVQRCGPRPDPYLLFDDESAVPQLPLVLPVKPSIGV